MDTADHIAHYECFLQLFELVGLFKRIIVILRWILWMMMLMMALEWLCTMMIMMPTKLQVFQNEDDNAPGGDNIWQSRFLPRDAWPSCLAKRLANKKI